MSDRKEQYEQGIITTTDGKAPQSFDAPAPAPIGANGQHGQYWVLSEEERAKGFVLPVRNSYRHVGKPSTRNKLRDLTSEEHEEYDRYGYVKYEEYSEEQRAGSSVVGRFWTQKDLDRVGNACNGVTTMGRALAETYAAKPTFYGATMCVHCGAHFPVGADGEFVWEGTDERLGT